MHWSEKGVMRVRAKLHALFKIGVKDPEGIVELTLPEGTDIAGLVETLRETSPTVDPRACLVIIDDATVPLDYTLGDGEEVHLYPLFTGG